LIDIQKAESDSSDDSSEEESSDDEDPQKKKIKVHVVQIVSIASFKDV